VSRIRRMIRWAVAEEMLPAGVYHALQAIPDLRKGRTTARETEPVRPVSDSDVAATIEHLPEVVADLARFQRLTGCRPTEACMVRPGEIDRTNDVWEYRPTCHKTEHHDIERVIFIGPKAQAILSRHLLRSAGSYCFSPAESERRRRAAAHEKRVTPAGQGNSIGTNRKPKRTRPPKDHYTRHSYGKAIVRACKLAGVDPWSPNQLRHAAATEIRGRFGLEAAQVSLGHSNANVTQVYAERDSKLAMDVARQVG